jgi:hypothetical protein
MEFSELENVNRMFQNIRPSLQEFVEAFATPSSLRSERIG